MIPPSPFFKKSSVRLSCVIPENAGIRGKTEKGEIAAPRTLLVMKGKGG